MEDVEKKIEEMVACEICRMVDNAISFSSRDSESPIETLLTAAIVILGMEDKAQGRDKFSFTFSKAHSEEELVDESLDKMWDVIIARQVEIGSFRADYAAILTGNIYFKKRSYKLIIECDGHDFHEKTKEQAARDKARDRYFVNKGYNILRFTGSEIWRDPMECVHEIWDFFCSAWHEAKEENEIVKDIIKSKICNEIQSYNKI